jgi:long-chain acyl-CoA synthetase
MIAAIQASVDALNAKLNRWETIKKFVILDHDLTIGDGELTPSLKVKRKVVEDRYRNLLDALYS